MSGISKFVMHRNVYAVLSIFVNSLRRAWKSKYNCYWCAKAGTNAIKTDMKHSRNVAISIKLDVPASRKNYTPKISRIALSGRNI